MIFRLILWKIILAAHRVNINGNLQISLVSILYFYHASHCNICASGNSSSENLFHSRLRHYWKIAFFMHISVIPFASITVFHSTPMLLAVRHEIIKLMLPVNTCDKYCGWLYKLLSKYKSKHTRIMVDENGLTVNYCLSSKVHHFYKIYFSFPVFTSM